MYIHHFNQATKRSQQLKAVKRTLRIVSTYTGYLLMIVATYLALVVIAV